VAERGAGSVRRRGVVLMAVLLLLAQVESGGGNAPVADDYIGHGRRLPSGC
jgi:hypothetical protein